MDDVKNFIGCLTQIIPFLNTLSHMLSNSFENVFSFQDRNEKLFFTFYIARGRYSEPEAYSRPCQISKMEHFAKTLNT